MNTNSMHEVVTSIYRMRCELYIYIYIIGMNTNVIVMTNKCVNTFLVSRIHSYSQMRKCVNA